MKQVSLILGLFFSSGFALLPTFYPSADFLGFSSVQISPTERIIAEYTGTDEDGNTESIDTSKELLG
ncbi:MAG: hypothetical protein ACRC8A_05330 [Microcoleaceae cyanobacterium]